MRRTALAVVGALVLAGGSVRAHHGYANFFMDRTVTVEGQVEQVRFVNPHVILKVRAADSTVYTALFHQGASWFRDREAAIQGLKAGDHIVVVASPPRDPASHEVVSIKEVRRPRDGWIWKRAVS